MKYHVEDDRIIVAMMRGENLLDNLLTVAKEHNIKAGTFTGIGAVENVTLGRFDPKRKEYDKREFPSSCELVSFTGNISLKDGKPFIHCHAVITDHDLKAYGGHLFGATVAVVGEFVIFPIDGEIIRTYDEKIGLAVWDLEGCSYDK